MKTLLESMNRGFERKYNISFEPRKEKINESKSIKRLTEADRIYRGGDYVPVKDYEQDMIANRNYIYAEDEEEIFDLLDTLGYKEDEIETHLNKWKRYPKLYRNGSLVIPKGTKIKFKEKNKYFATHVLPEYDNIEIYTNADDWANEISKYFSIPMSDEEKQTRKELIDRNRLERLNKNIEKYQKIIEKLSTSRRKK